MGERHQRQASIRLREIASTLPQRENILHIDAAMVVRLAPVAGMHWVREGGVEADSLID